MLDEKHRIIVKPSKIAITPMKDAKDDTNGENNPEDVDAPVEHKTSDDKTDGEEGDAAKATTGSLDKLWVREMSLTEQPEEYNSDADQEWVPPPIIYNSDYDEVEEMDAVISEEELKMLLEEGLTEDKKDWKQAVEPRDESLPPLLCGCQPNKPENQKQEPADKRPHLPQPTDSTGLTPALKKLKHVVVLKQLVNGPYKVNGCTLHRVNQKYLLANSNCVNVSGVKVSDNVDDKYFQRVKTNLHRF